MTAMLSKRDEAEWVRSVVNIAAQVSDESLFQLHRVVSRLAQQARQRDPEYQQRQRLGSELARR